MTDIVERLRLDAEPTESDMEEAATEIERLRVERARLRLALRIIAGYEQCLDNLMSNGDLARAALGEDQT